MIEQNDLRTVAARLDQWLMTAALPLWWKKGADHGRGGWYEALRQDGTPVQAPRRARVQPRQIYVYAMAGRMGWTGPWRAAADHGLIYLMAHYLRLDGLIATLVFEDGVILDDRATIYDQAFALLAMAEVLKSDPTRTDLAAPAQKLLETLLATRRHPNGGFVEAAAEKFQSNPHMHLLEAALSWAELEPGGIWDRVADEIVALALSRFIDADGGFLREFFDADWRPAAGHAGRILEPGHQFEWAWLLARWSKLRRDAKSAAAARKLFENGLKGIDPVRGVAVHQMSEQFTVTMAVTRLWHQTEWLKAALILKRPDEALRAALALERFLATPITGLWWDKMTEAGGFIDEPAPASSFYHIVCCIAELRESLVHD